MAINAKTIWEFRASATANNVNAGGFNPSNANFLTDLTTDASTGNTDSPVCSSASYNFVAGDVGAWIYVKSGTNWTPGWYVITAVASNKATVNATIGSAVAHNTTNNTLSASTVVGVATVATPTGGTFGIDYSQQDAAKIAYTDLAGTTTSLTSAASPFNTSMVGNIIHITSGTGFTVGWYEIVSVSGVTATIDRSAGATGSSGVAKLGGAISLNSTLDDNVFAAFVGGNQVFIESGTYSLGETISIAASGVTATNPLIIRGYNTLRMDAPAKSSRPTISCATYYISTGNFKSIENINFTGSSTYVIYLGTACIVKDCYILNTSSTPDRPAISIGDTCHVRGLECVSQNGAALGHQTVASIRVTNCYVHDSLYGVQGASQGTIWENCIFEGNRTAQWNHGTTAGHYIENCTFVGPKIGATRLSLGLSFTTYQGNPVSLYNNIFKGCSTGVNYLSGFVNINHGDYNCFYDNGTNTSYFKTFNDIIEDPEFEDYTVISGTTATSSGSVLTQAGGDFSTVEDNVDFLNVISGTGVTTGGYLITGHTSTTLTVNNALGTSGAGNINYYVTTGRNFEIGTNLKAGASVDLNTETTSYIDIGAVQRQGGGSQISHSSVS